MSNRYARRNRWTVSALAKQIRSAAGDACLHKSGVTLTELRTALERWGILGDARPPLDDADALNEALDAMQKFGAPAKRKARAVAPSKPAAVPPAHNAPASLKMEAGFDNELSLADVLTFARRVADDDAAAVSATRLDDAVRRSRRRAATAARLREGAADLDALRRALRARGVELDAWLEAAERVVPLNNELHPSGTLSAPAALSAGDLAAGLAGLLRINEAPADDRNGLRRCVDRAVEALAAFAREPADFGALELRELRAAHARAAAVAGGLDGGAPSDAALVDAASDRRDAVVFRVAEAVDALLQTRKWRAADLLTAARAFDDGGDGLKGGGPSGHVRVPSRRPRRRGRVVAAASPRCAQRTSRRSRRTPALTNLGRRDVERTPPLQTSLYESRTPVLWRETASRRRRTAAAAKGQRRTTPAGTGTTPRALCRAFRAWGLFACRDANEEADYARFIGEPRTRKSAEPAPPPPPPPPSKDPFARTTKAPRRAPKAKAAPAPVRKVSVSRRPRPVRSRPTQTARRTPSPAPRGSSSAPRSAAQTAKDAEEADLLAQLECALVTMASKISHIESKLEGQG